MPLLSSKSNAFPSVPAASARSVAWLIATFLLYTLLLGYFPVYGAWEWVGWGLAQNLPSQLLSEPFFPSLCLFKQLTHLPCLFCGMTRSMALVGQGQWAASLNYHLLGLPVYGLSLVLMVFGFWKPHWAAWLLGLVMQRWSVGLLLVLFFGCWLWKLTQDPLFW